MASSVQYTKETIRVFCPNSRSLSPQEIAAIPAEERTRAEFGESGTWLELHCPDERCLTGERKTAIEVRGVDPREKEGLWHKLFCPDDTCFVDSPTDLP